MTDKPDFRTQPEAWKQWLNQEKLRQYNATHKTVIDWNGELIAPPEFYGSWVEIKHVIGHGLCFDFQKNGIEKVSHEKIKAVTKDIGDILELIGEDVDLWSPYIIEIDSKGQCHLLACMDYSDYEDNDARPRTMDMVLRIGSKDIIRVGGK